MKQQTLTGFEKYVKTTRRGQFLADRNKSRVHAKVEHVFDLIKNIFGFRNVRYRLPGEESAPPGSDGGADESVQGPSTIAQCVGTVSVESPKCAIYRSNAALRRAKTYRTARSDRISGICFLS